VLVRVCREAVNSAGALRRTRGDSPKTCCARLSAYIIPRSEQTVLVRVCREAVNSAGALRRTRGDCPKTCKARLSARIILYFVFGRYISDVFAYAKVMLLTSFVMMLLPKVAMM